MANAIKPMCLLLLIWIANAIKRMFLYYYSDGKRNKTIVFVVAPMANVIKPMFVFVIPMANAVKPMFLSLWQTL